MATSPENPQGNEQPAFSIDNALNTKGFAEFLASSDISDVEDVDEVEYRFEIFKKKEVVKEKLKDLYKGKIKESLGIALTTENMAAISKHIEQEATQNPEAIEELFMRINAFNALPGEIQAAEEKLAAFKSEEALVSEIENLDQDRANVQFLSKYSGIGGKGRLALTYLTSGFSMNGVAELHHRKAAKEQLQARYGANAHKNKQLFSEINKRLADHTDALEQVQALSDMKAASEAFFAESREDLLGGIANVKELTDALEAKVQQQLAELQTQGGMKNLLKAQELFERLQAVSESELGIDPFNGKSAEDIQAEIDTALESAAQNEIITAINAANFGDNSLTKLEQKLTDHIERTKLGSKDSDEVRDFVIKALTNAASTLGASVQDKAKRLLVQRIIIKLETKN